jgi:hypothetical protein
MATETQIILTDSLDPRIASNVETVTFYDPHTGEKREKKASASKSDLTEVREWAKANGYTVGDRGRIKAEILEAFDKAMADNIGKGAELYDETKPETDVKLESALENSAVGNVVDLGDFTKYADDDFEQERAVDDYDQGNLDDMPETEVESEQNGELTDDMISDMMREIEAETGEPASLEQLQEKAKSDIPF